MTNTKISALTALAAQPASNDLLAIVDVSDTSQAASGTTKKIAAAYFAQTAGTVATITGGGTIALGGFTLTVPATGTAALLAVANIFTANNTIQPASTGSHGISVKMPASTTGDAIENYYNGVYRSGFRVRSSANICYVYSCDLGASVPGPLVFAGYNSNATTPSAGCIDLADRTGGDHYYWTDASGNMRTGSAQPTSAASDTSGGTVVGTQTSMAEAKNISESLPDPVESLRGILYAAKHGLRGWNYKSGSFNNEQFPVGIVTDLAPRYGMDRDEEHPAGKSLNIPVAIGDLMAAVAVILNKIGIDNEGDLESWLA